jgi:hypothetical protein
VRDRRLPLVAVGRTLIFPIGIYSRRHRKVTDIPAGGRIAIPNDPANGGRALVLLAASGAVRLSDNADFRATVADIVENPRPLRIVELEAAQLPRVLDEVEAATINTNFAIAAGLNPVRDAIALESADSPYANLVIVRLQDREAPWVARLLAAYQSDEGIRADHVPGVRRPGVLIGGVPADREAAQPARHRAGLPARPALPPGDGRPGPSHTLGVKDRPDPARAITISSCGRQRLSRRCASRRRTSDEEAGKHHRSKERQEWTTNASPLPARPPWSSAPTRSRP